MAMRNYILIPNNIQDEIISKRKKKFGSEQIVVIIKGIGNGVYDPTDQIELTISIKIKKDNDYYAEAISFGNGEVTDENVSKAIEYLTTFKFEYPLSTGIPIHSRSIARISLDISKGK